MQGSIIQTSREWGVMQATTDTNPENMILRKRNQTPLATHCVPAFASSVQSRQIYRGSEQTSRAGTRRKGESGSCQVWGLCWVMTGFWRDCSGGRTAVWLGAWVVHWVGNCMRHDPSSAKLLRKHKSEPFLSSPVLSPSLGRPTAAQETKKASVSRTHSPETQQFRQTSAHTHTCSSSLENWSSPTLSRKWARNIVLNFLVGTLKKLKGMCKI